MFIRLLQKAGCMCTHLLIVTTMTPCDVESVMFVDNYFTLYTILLFLHLSFSSMDYLISFFTPIDHGPGDKVVKLLP